MVKMIPFIFGILGGYAFAGILTAIGFAANIDAIKILNTQPFADLLTNGKVTIETFFSIPDFTFLTAYKGFGELNPV